MCGQKRADDYLIKVFASSSSINNIDISKRADTPPLKDCISVSYVFIIYPYDQIHLHHERSQIAPLRLPIPPVERFGTPFEQSVRF
ncbi:hypothetical protein SAMN05421578_106162 [Paenibacillus macquariensis]|uniref:Uncharacterized protein n=1 Tax=Paenibacillus macquariensis TaxID=948756 RepID=A0ABY1JZZ1_9BACL|nr:hypothetical protein SAMN05421578_106162 [Paenibacillus macquariensis]